MSVWTEIGLWLITITSFILIVVFWNKFSENKFRNFVFRLLSLVVIQFLAMASVGVMINRANFFYTSWSDLFGDKAALAKVAISPAALADVSSSDVAHAKRTQGGSLIFRLVVKGNQSGVTDTVYIVASPKIAKLLTSSDHPSIGSDYQVVELFPGYPGVPETWIGSLGGIASMEKLEIAGSIKPTIAIIPAINVVPGQDSECTNIPGGAQVETWLSKDMLTLAHRFMGIDNRPWSTFGYSTGAWCATELGIRHQDQYGRAISLAGYFSPSFEAGVHKKTRELLYKEYDLLKTLKANQNSLKLLLLASPQDSFSYSATKRFMKAASNLVSIKFINIPAGGHNTAVWRPFIKTGFLWINEVS